MTTEEYIKDFNGVIIGIVETKDNGDQLVREFSTRRILGYYIKDRNHTTDFMGRILTQGNTVIALLFTQK
ncbi:MAG: hypothetical protein IJU20_06755 [Clostridia bacterium]|nr:hypothetical protein [Clostridia bacterium]